MNVHEFTALNERLKAKQAELFDHLTQDPSAAVTPALERLLHILDWVRLEHFIDDGCGQGRPPRDHFAIANAFMAKAVLGIGSDKTEFELDGRQITLHGNTLKDAAGTLAGAHLPMDQAVRNMVHFGGASQASALRMAASAPAHLLGLAHELGYLACGYRAGLTLLSEDLQAQAVVADGHFFSCNS